MTSICKNVLSFTDLYKKPNRPQNPQQSEVPLYSTLGSFWRTFAIVKTSSDCLYQPKAARIVKGARKPSVDMTVTPGA